MSMREMQMIYFNEEKCEYSASFTIKGFTDSFAFNIASPDFSMIKDFFQLFISVFPIVIDFEKKKIEPAFYNTKEVRDRVGQFVEAYQDQLIQIRALPSFFSDIKDGEMLLLLPFSGMPQKESMLYYTYLASVAEGRDFEQEKSEFDDIFGEFLDKYTVHVYGDRKLKIGAGLKSERVCRFCNNGRVPLTFKGVAHAISEALGNKKLKLNEECDGCNNFFAREIEPDIVEYFSFFRTFHKIEGKGGVKKVKGENFTFENGEDGLELHYTDGTDAGIYKKDSYLNVPLEHKKIITQNLYKCLVKYFLSVVDSKHLSLFTETIRWLNGDVAIDRLPPVLKFLFPGSFQKEPKMTTYIRKVPDNSIPFAVGEFHFTILKFAFILPLCKNDTIDFIREDEFQNFISCFEHYKRVEYVKEDWSSNLKRTFILNININPSTKP